MSALVIDTSAWVSYFAGKSRLAAEIDGALEEGRVYVTPVVAAELLSGRLTAGQRERLQDLLSDLPLCGTEREHWFRVGQLRASLAARGLSVSTPDAHVAQCALDLGAALMTEDAIFRKVSAHRALVLVD